MLSQVIYMHIQHFYLIHEQESVSGTQSTKYDPSIKFILWDETLCELDDTLPELFSPFLNFLRSVKALHLLCTARELEDHDIVLHDFKVNFDFLFINFNMNRTLKIHIILHHYKEYFDLAGKTLRHTNGEFVESAHYLV